MTKETYQEIRQKGELNMELCHDYWQETKKQGYTDITLIEFIKKFTEFIHNYSGVPIPAPDNSVKLFNPSTVMNKVFDHFDKKFL